MSGNADVSLLNLFKLEKLRIEAFVDARRKRPADPARMEAMFNPTSYKRSHAVAYAHRRKGVAMQGWPSRFAYTAPGSLALQLVFDGTGVHQFGAERLVKPRSVKKDIKAFEQLCLRMNGEIHQPNFLVVRWGDFSFAGRLQTLDISYTLFDEAGDPLRAELAVSFVEDIADTTAALTAAKSSPDLTHVRIVKAGDTLPLLCRDVYGSSRHYLTVARHNALDGFRRLEPGQRIVFPPLDAAAGDQA